ncbi:MAG: thiamine phosphate synthase [Planctomycetota bacterium]|nr:MAG: thiamine phosphate synthase [Planctomycetota bacterium]
MAPPTFRLCFLLSRDLCAGRDPLLVLEAAVRGGVDCVQMREKELDGPELHAWGLRLRRACRRLGVPLIVNDRLELALALEAEGVHLGQDDLHPADARRLAGDRLWIGWSTHDLEQLDEAAEVGADYAGFGPVFATPTKGYETGLGPEAVAAALAIARLPVVAIGGIRPENAWMIPDQAAVAVSSGIGLAADPEAAARGIRAARNPERL